LQEIAEAMNEEVASSYPHLLDGSLHSLLERRKAADGSGTGTWVRPGVVIPRGFTFGVYAGRVQRHGAFKDSEYILATDSIKWGGVILADLEIDGAPAPGAGVPLANAAGYNHACGKATARLVRHRWGPGSKRGLMAVAKAARKLVGPVQLRWNYGDRYLYTVEEAAACERDGVAMTPCLCAAPAQCPRARWLRKGK
jgi:hypothetical protein